MLNYKTQVKHHDHALVVNNECVQQQMGRHPKKHVHKDQEPGVLLYHGIDIARRSMGRPFNNKATKEIPLNTTTGM